ncbi:serine hydrolase [Kurthia huakuii]|uniref:serine hydrolase n=1 Tax=Kurthia huakuii TaxID=1421019 RepID=UPI000496EEC1|nr:serine hydrolase [Kurthia huakuii]MBM7699506.1 D-alanyl-D-alanine carboxypeptidase [Kurthia huakuii]
MAIAIAIIIFSIFIAVLLMRGPSPRFLVNYIKKHRENGNVSLHIKFEEKDWVRVNESHQLPLASTVKWLVATEFARQASVGMINPKKEIPVTAMENYYLPHLDGGAHSAWLSQLEGVVVSLEDVATGMMRHSSNANTDYLIDLLGLNNINKLAKDLGLSEHAALYPLSASQYFPYVYMIEHHLTPNEGAAALRQLDTASYEAGILSAHEQLKQTLLTAEQRKEILSYLPLDVQRVWSDRLPKATTTDYVKLMELLNTRAIYDDAFYDVLDPIIDTAKVNPRRYKQYAEKGGSTAWVLTMAMYATKVNDTTMQLAFFANTESLKEQRKLQRTIHRFIGKFVTDARFREYVRDELK